MRSFFAPFCFALLLTGTCGVSLVEQREISTDQIRCRILDEGWPKGLFYGIEDTLYWIRFRAGRLFVYSLSEGKIDGRRIVDLSDTSDNLRMTDVTSDSRDALFVLFSGHENLIVRLSLDGSTEIRKTTFSAVGHAHTIRYVADLNAVAVVINQTLALVVNEDGSFKRFGPEFIHGNNCCTYTTTAVNGNTAALNVDGGLRLFSENHEQIIWRESASGFISEVASAGETWAAIETRLGGESAGIRIFLTKDHRYSSRVFPLPKPDDPLSKGDGYWRITDNGNQAIAWSRRSDAFFRVSEQAVDKFRLKETTPRGRVCPAFSDNVFLIDSKGYTVISFD